MLIIASNNEGKIREYKQILKPFNFEIVSQSEYGVNVNPEEIGSTFAENAAIKARAIHEITRCPVLADDSGLIVDYLCGEPGVYSARYGNLKTSEERSNLVLQKLEGVSKDKRIAHFVCSIHMILSSGQEIKVQGSCDGYIGYEPVGTNGFGYDPIFMYNGKSFAEMSEEEKNKVSHRAIALRNLINKLKGNKRR